MEMLKIKEGKVFGAKKRRKTLACHELCEDLLKQDIRDNGLFGEE